MDGYIRQREFWMESESIQKFSKTPEKVEEDTETNEILDFLLDLDTDNLIQIHQDNVREYLGKRILFKTKGLFTVGKIIRISESNCSIGIENNEDKDKSTHKKTLNIPKLNNGTRVGKIGRNVYLLD